MIPLRRSSGALVFHLVGIRAIGLFLIPLLVLAFVLDIVVGRGGERDARNSLTKQFSVLADPNALDAVFLDRRHRQWLAS